MSFPYFNDTTGLPGSVNCANTSRKMSSPRPPLPYRSHHSYTGNHNHNSYTGNNNNNNNNNTGSLGNSWPPTQLRIGSLPTPDDDGDVPLLERGLDMIDEDPLTFFLTPIKDHDNDPMMDFDAGIEGSSAMTSFASSPDLIRSVSPSQLFYRGGKKSTSGDFTRWSTPPRSPPGLGESTDEEMDDDEYDVDDDDHYVRLGFFGAQRQNHHHHLRRQQQQQQAGLLPLMTLRDLTSGDAGTRSSVTRRGRGVVHSANSGRRRLEPRSWREPSPEVWMIEEEPEDGEVAAEVAAVDQGKKKSREGRAKKTVRFVLPLAEESFH